MNQAPNPASASIARAAAYLGSFPKAVWLLVLATVIESTGRFMVVPYLSLYLRGSGVSLGALGLVLGTAPLASVVFGAWGGHLSDSWGRKPVQILGVALSGLALFGFAFAGTDVRVLAFLNFLNGMTRTFYRPATSAALADHSPADRRAETFALHRIAINAAYGWGPIIGVAIFATSPRAGFVAAGVLNLLVGVFIAFAVPESAAGRRSANRRNAGPAAPLEATDRMGSDPVAKGRAGHGMVAKALARHEVLRDILADRVFWLWTLGMVLAWGAYGLIQSFLPLHLEERGIGLWTYGAALAVNALVCVFVQLPVSRRLRVARIGPSAGGSKLAFAAGFLGFAFLTESWAILAAMFVLSLGEVWGSAVQNRFVPEHVDPSRLGLFLGLGVVTELGQAVVAPAAGFAMQAWGGRAVFSGAAVLALAGGACLYLAGCRHDRSLAVASLGDGERRGETASAAQ